MGYDDSMRTAADRPLDPATPEVAPATRGGDVLDAGAPSPDAAIPEAQKEAGTEMLGGAAGAMTGAVAGAVVAGPIGALVGGVVGAAVGAAAGEATEGSDVVGAAGGSAVGAAIGAVVGSVAGPVGAAVGGGLGAAGGAAVGEGIENGLRGSDSATGDGKRPDYAGMATPERSTPPPISSNSWKVTPDGEARTSTGAGTAACPNADPGDTTDEVPRPVSQRPVEPLDLDGDGGTDLR